MCGVAAQGEELGKINAIARPDSLRKSREIEGILQRAEETGGNLLSGGGAVKTGGVDRSTRQRGATFSLSHCLSSQGFLSFSNLARISSSVPMVRSNS